MTERAVRETYAELLEDATAEMLDVVAAEFGGGLTGRIARSGAKRVTRELQREMQTQGTVVVDYAAAVVEGAPTDAHERRFLRTNPVYRRYDGPRQGELEAELLAHLADLGEDLAPLVAAPTDDFWAALAAEYDRETAIALFERHFSRAKTFTEYRKGLFPSERLGDRVIAIVEKGEERVLADVRERTAAAYETAGE